MGSKPPVIVSLNVEGFASSASDTIEIDRSEWDSMTPAERTRCLEEAADAFAQNYVGWGWNIEDSDDYNETA